MKRVVAGLIVLSLSAVTVSSTHARNEKLILPIERALADDGVEDKPSGSVKFFFGTQNPGNVVAELGSYVANPRSDAMGRSDESACNRAFLWTLVALEKRARAIGANAVVKIVSYYNNAATPNVAEFECHVGHVIARVALKGEFVKIAER